MRPVFSLNDTLTWRNQNLQTVRVFICITIYFCHYEGNFVFVIFLRYRPPDVLLGSTEYSTHIDMW